MKNHWLVFFLFYTSVFSQQKTIGEFTELIIKDGLHVTLISGDKNAISITSENQSDSLLFHPNNNWAYIGTK